MTDLFLLSEAQMGRIAAYFPLSHGIAWVDDLLIVSAIGSANRSSRKRTGLIQANWVSIRGRG